MKYAVIYALSIAGAFAGTAWAGDFSKNSEARSWNLYGEQPALFEGKVVDVLCEITGDCAENCGEGRRQMGIVRSQDGVLVFPNKNAQANFAGAVQELLPYCNQMVEVDGLLIEDPDLGAKNIYLVQKIRALGADKWVKANSWSKKWAKANPEAKGKGPWFRRHPGVKAEIAADGYTGIGVEAEAQFVKEWHE